MTTLMQVILTKLLQYCKHIIIVINIIINIILFSKIKQATKQIDYKIIKRDIKSNKEICVLDDSIKIDEILIPLLKNSETTFER